MDSQKELTLAKLDPGRIRNTTGNMAGTLRKAVSSVLPSSPQTPFPVGTTGDGRDPNQENSIIEKGHLHNSPGTDVAKIDPHGMKKPRLQRSAPKMPTITGCSPRVYAPKPVPLPPELVRRIELPLKREKAWKALAKRMVSFRPSEKIKGGSKSRSAEEKEKTPAGESNEPKERVYKFREVSKGPILFPSFAYDEISAVVKRRNRSATNVKSSPKDPVALKKTQSSENPLPPYPPLADPARDIRATIGRSIIDAKDIPLRRVLPRKSNIQEEWSTLIPSKPGNSVSSVAKDESTENRNPCLTPAPPSTDSRSTVSSLVSFYGQDTPITEYSVTIDDSKRNSQNLTLASTIVAGGSSEISTNPVTTPADSPDSNPFIDSPVVKNPGVSARHTINTSRSSVPLSLPEGLPVAADASICPQSTNPFLNTSASHNRTNTSLTLHSNIDVTKPETRLRLPSSGQFSPLLDSSHKKRASAPPSTSHLQNMDVNKGNHFKDKRPSAPKPPSRIAASGRNISGGFNSPTGATHQQLNRPSASGVGRHSVPRTQDQGSHLLIQPKADSGDTKIPRAPKSSLRASLTPTGTPDKRQHNLNPSAENRSSIPVPARVLSARNTPSKDVPNRPGLPGKSRIVDMLTDPIPEEENAALAPPVLPQKANTPVTARAESDSDDDFVFDENEEILVRPPTVFTGEYRTKRLSRARPDHGPSLRIFPSAENVIMGGEDRNDDHDATKDGTGKQHHQSSITEGLRASIGSRISSMNLKRTSFYPGSAAAQESHATKAQDGEPSHERKAESDNIGNSSSTGRARSQTSPERSAKRDFSGKEMNLFRRLGHKPSLSSLSSFHSQPLLPEDTPPVPKLPIQHTGAGNRGYPMSAPKAVTGVQTTPAGTERHGMCADSRSPSFPGTRGIPKRPSMLSKPLDFDESPEYRRRVTESTPSPRDFPPRTSSHQFVPDYTVRGKSKHINMNATGSVPDLRSGGHFRGKYDLRSEDGSKGTPSATAAGRMAGGPTPQPSTSRSSRVLSNIRGIFGKQKTTGRKNSTTKDDTIGPSKSSDRANIWERKAKDNKDSKKAQDVRKGKAQKEVKQSKSSKGGRVDRDTGIPEATPIQVPRPIPRSGSTYVHVPTPDRRRHQTRTPSFARPSPSTRPGPSIARSSPPVARASPSFARPTHATLTRAAANARTPPTASTMMENSAAAARAARAPIVTAAGSPLRPTRIQHTVNPPAGQPNIPLPGSRPSPSASLRTQAPVTPGPSTPAKAPSPTDSLARFSADSMSSDPDALQIVPRFVKELQKQATEESDSGRRAKIDAHIAFFGRELSAYNNLEKLVEDAELLCLERQVDRDISKKNILRAINDIRTDVRKIRALRQTGPDA